ncbi:basic endochitinase-like protein [Carex littledalei]|uniref:chitinase n=1 Tax=Carex littledalei TaxID=544730 RepID=A0A833QWJ5_9POAL|nr:basic endochitinase-like protein [Carex littledalei]
MAHLSLLTSSSSSLLFSFSLLFFFSLTCNVEARYWQHNNCNPISSIVTEKLYNSLFLHKDDAACPAKGFYNYSSFIQATKCFPQFGNTGDMTTRKREIAAFFAQISHETTGGWATAPDGPYAWGLCFKEEKPKPSCHDVMVGRYHPTAADIAANRTAGFGLVTNIINGGLECGIPDNAQSNDRIGYYKKYAQIFGVDVGSNLDCANQQHY